MTTEARWLAKACAASADIADEEDREAVLSDLATIPYGPVQSA